MTSPVPLYIGLDLGTSGCRSSAIDSNGLERASARVGLPPPVRTGSAVEQDPEQWWGAVRACLAELARRLPADGRVQTLAVDGTSGTILLADAAGRPLAPALMYNDARATAEAARAAKAAPPETAAHGAGGGLAKLLWLLGRHPGAAHALHQADWIVGRLTGRVGLSDPNNCLKTGYDPIAGAWPEWLDPLGVPRAVLPEVRPGGSPLATLRGATAREIGLPPDTVVVAGTTDSTAAILATGVDRPGEAVTSLGSTLVTKVLCKRPVFAPEYGVYSQPFGKLWLAGGGSNSGGAVLRHFFSDAEMAMMTPRLDPARPTGLDYYPLLVPGERFPVNDPYLAPRLEPRPSEPARFFQGLLEGLARIEARAYRRLAELGAPYPARVRTVGGGARNPAWTRIRARLLNAELVEAVHSEAAYGSALLARRGDRKQNEYD